MPYRIELAPQARRELRKLPRDDQSRVQQRIDTLADAPRPSGCEKLAGQRDLYRVRVGTFRIIYRVDDDRLLVLIVHLGNRRDIYRYL